MIGDEDRYDFQFFDERVDANKKTVLRYFIIDKHASTPCATMTFTSTYTNSSVIQYCGQQMQILIEALNSEFISYDVDLQDYLGYVQRKKEKAIFASEEQFEDSCDI